MRLNWWEIAFLVILLALVVAGAVAIVRNALTRIPVGEVLSKGYSPAWTEVVHTTHHSGTGKDAITWVTTETRHHPEQYTVTVRGEASSGGVRTKWYVVDSATWHELEVGQSWQTPDYRAGR